MEKVVISAGRRAGRPFLVHVVLYPPAHPLKQLPRLPILENRPILTPHTTRQLDLHVHRGWTHLLR